MRTPRIVPLGLAGVTTVAALGALAAPAGAASSGTPVFRGQTSAAVVSLAVHVPQLGDPLGLGDPITLQLIGSQGGALKKVSGDPTSTSTSTLAGGSLVNQLLTSLGQSTTATLSDPSPAQQQLIPVPSNPLGLTGGVGTLNANVTKSSLGNASTAQLVGAGLGSLSAVPGASALTAPLQAGLTTGINQIISALSPLTQQLQDPNNQIPIPPISIPNPLSSLIPGSPTSITVTVPSLADLGTAVNALPTTLNSVIDALLNRPLVSIDGLSTGQSIVPSGKGLVSSATAKLADIKLLGGLLLVNGITSTATATATGSKGAPKATADATLVKVSINTGDGSPLGDLLNVALNTQGLAADVLKNSTIGTTVNTLAQQLNDAVGALIAQLNSLLSLLGVKVVQSDNSATTAADGKSAEAHASGALVSVTLPTDATPIVSLRLGASDATAAYEVEPVTVSPASTTKVNSPGKNVTPAKKLAYTGSDPVLVLAATGLLGLGAGLALRRRRTVA